MAYDETVATMGGVATTPIEKPKSRAEKIREWKAANQSAYKTACDDNCTCTPTRAQMLLIEQWDNPPID